MELTYTLGGRFHRPESSSPYRVSPIPLLPQGRRIEAHSSFVVHDVRSSSLNSGCFPEHKTVSYLTVSDLLPESTIMKFTHVNIFNGNSKLLSFVYCFSHAFEKGAQIK